MAVTILKPIKHGVSANRRMLRGRKLQSARMRIFAENDFTCAACKLTLLPKYLELDHRIPLAHGGTDDDSNLQPLCVDCHKEKTFACSGSAI